VRGVVVLDPVSDLAGRIAPGMKVSLGEHRSQKTVVRLIPHGRRYLLELKGIASREDAEPLRDTEVRVRLKDVGPIPPNTYFRWQIIGLTVVEEDGTVLGTIADVLDTGANDVYEVERQEGRRLLLPAIDSVIRQIDLEAGVVHVHLLPGLADL
jgi:16S rRNA processing protein RimM